MEDDKTDPPNWMEAGEAYTKEGGNGVAAATYKLLIERYMEDHKDG